MKRSRKADCVGSGADAAMTLQGPARWHEDFLRTFALLTQHNRPGQVFGDFVEMAACAISNSVDRRQAPGREARYTVLCNSYTCAEDRALFPKLLGAVTMALELEMHDAIGHLWTKLELGDGWKGQYFTPYEVSYLMAQLTFADCQGVIDKHGFVSASEPACGPGGMIVAMAHAMQDQGIDYQQKLHVHGIDIDPRCAHMAYVQASLLGIPAIITVGDTLRWELKEHWLTPMHVLGNWSAKLAERQAQDAAHKLMLGQPTEAAIPPLELPALAPVLAEAAE